QPGLECFDQRAAALLADGMALFGRTAADVALDPVEIGDAHQRLGGNRRRTALGEFVEAAADMAPAEGQTYFTPLGQHLVASVAVYLQDTAKAGEMGDRLRGLAVRGIDIGHAGRIAATPGSVVPGIGPELTGLGPPPSRIEHRCRRLVGEKL